MFLHMCAQVWQTLTRGIPHEHAPAVLSGALMCAQLVSQMAFKICGSKRFVDRLFHETSNSIVTATFVLIVFVHDAHNISQPERGERISDHARPDKSSLESLGTSSEVQHPRLSRNRCRCGKGYMLLF